MTKTRARQEPTNITVTVSIDLQDHWTEREIREDIVPPRVFAALARDLAQAVEQRIHPYDVACITVGEPGRRNFAHVFATPALWRKWGVLRTTRARGVTGVT